jgi:hypothetical protein
MTGGYFGLLIIFFFIYLFLKAQILLPQLLERFFFLAYLPESKRIRR